MVLNYCGVNGFMFRFIVFSSIGSVGSGSMFRVYWLLLNIVFFFSRGG